MTSANLSKLDFSAANSKMYGRYRDSELDVCFEANEIR